MLVKCTKCHHEWQATTYPTTDRDVDTATCDWCGAPGEKLADSYVERWRIAGAEVCLTKEEIRNMIKRLEKKEGRRGK